MSCHILAKNIIYSSYIVNSVPNYPFIKMNHLLMESYNYMSFLLSQLNQNQKLPSIIATYKNKTKTKDTHFCLKNPYRFKKIKRSNVTFVTIGNTQWNFPILLRMALTWDHESGNVSGAGLHSPFCFHVSDGDSK